MRRRAIAITALALLAAGGALANYHFIYYATSGPPYTPIFERFPVETLYGGQVPFLIVDPGSSLQLAPGDTFASLVSQIRGAAAVWNTVPTSTLRFQFAGIATPNVTMNSPAVVISFDELPPGVIAMAGPVTKGQVTSGANGQQYVPILRSSMVIGPDLHSPGVSSTGIGPSWSDRLFMTLVHEFGHTLGLQHTWTSSAMSTEITRAMTRAHPLGADDIAAASILYPTPAWVASYGSITGQVTMNGNGVALASVVALAPGAEAVSTLTNPDGTYEIDGLAPGPYQVYVHTVPPSLPGESYSGDLTPPTTPQGPVQMTSPFNTIFASGTSSPGAPISVAAGAVTPGVNFSVTPRTAVNIYGVQTYSFLWDDAASDYDIQKPATFQLGSGAGTAVATGDGLFAPDGVNLAPGLTASVLGAPNMVQGLAPYAYGAGYLQFQVSTAGQTTPGPQHLILQQGTETEVVPSAISLTANLPPAIGGVLPNGDGTVTVKGTGIGPSTRVLFDGAFGAVQAASSGQLTVVPPPALPGATPAVIAVNPGDQDSSFFTPAAAPPTYAVPYGQAPVIQLSPASVPAGQTVLVEITGTSVDFTAANMQIGFGSSDVAVQQLWVLSAQRAVAQVAVAQAAQLGQTTVTLSSGLQFLEIPAGFQVTAAQPPSGPSVTTFVNRVVAGGIFVLDVLGVPITVPGSSFTVTVSGPSGDEPAPIVFSIPGPLLFVMAPPDLQPGPAIVKVGYNGQTLPPLMFNVDAPLWPNIVQAVSTASGLRNSDSNPDYQGDDVVLTVQDLDDSLAPMDLSTISVNLAGMPQTVTSVQQDPTTDTAVVHFTLNVPPQTALPADLPLTIAYAGRVSLPFLLSVATH